MNYKKLRQKVVLLISFIFVVYFSVYFTTAGIFKTNTQVVNELTNGLVGYWTFDGRDTNWGTNITNDKSSNLNNLQIYGLSTTTSPVAGKIGQAITFNGTNYLEKIGATGLPQGGNPFTISVFLKPSLVNSYRYALSWGTRQTGKWNTFGVSLGKLNHVSFGFEMSGNTTLVANNWYHAVVTYDGYTVTNTMKLYLNGIVDKSANPTGVPNVTGSNLVIGMDNAHDWSYFGQMDEVRIYNRALSATEVTELYNQGEKRLIKINSSQAGKLTDGLTGYWSFDGEGTTWASASTGTVTNRGTLGGAQNMTNMSRETSPTNGKIGQALNFNAASSQHINTSLGLRGALFGANGENNPGTISVWVKPTGPPVNTDNNATYLPAIIGDIANGSFGIFRGTISGSDDKIWGYNGWESEATVGTTFTVGEWTHIILKKSSTHLCMYKNGIQVECSAHNSRASAATIDIGAYLAYFNGSMDELRFYNRALTDSEITELYNQGEKDLLKINMPQTDLIPQDLVGYWPFDGQQTNWSANTTNDLSGNNNTGSMINMSTSTSPIAGIAGQGLKFDGTNDYVQATNSSSLNPSTEITLAGWVYLDYTYPGVYTPKFFSFISKNTPNDGGYLLWFDDNNFGIGGDGRFTAMFAAGNAFDGAWGGKPSTDGFLLPKEWTHVAVTYNTSTQSIKFYKNGVIFRDTTYDSGNGNLSSTNNLLINYGTDSWKNYFKGTTDEVRIYNRVLSANEVAALYRAGAGIN